MRLVVITGASRGIGASVAIEFSRKYDTNTEFILLARDLNNLNETKCKMMSLNKINESFIKIIKFDFSNKNLELEDYKETLNKALDRQIKSYDELIVVYNHGTLDYGLIQNQTNQILQEKSQTNFISIWLLLNAIQSLFPENLVPKQFHINLNSSFSANPFANWSVQCCGIY
jgi:short-subunit dehydrogenase